jgi:TolA-binding protein
MREATMLREPPNTDASENDRPWERLAASLREQPDQPSMLDDFARARMERNLVDAWRSRGARAVPLQTSRPHFSRSKWLVSLAASAACGAMLAIYLLHDREPQPGAQAEVPARFDLVIDDGSVQSGFLTEGQVLESGQRGRVEVALDQSRLDVAPESRVRFERMARDELRLSLMKGRVEIAFHPERKGEQHMSVETRSARVLVVGTQFAVEVDSQGNTKVSVSEGVVQVVPRGDGETQFVRAGEHVEVPIIAPRERERAVREVIERQLAAEPPVGTDARSGAGTGGESEKTESAFGSARSRDARRQQCADDSTPDDRLESARKLLLQGKHAAARAQLQRIAKKNTMPTSTRVEALVLIAESYTAQGQIPRATETYREAVSVAPRHPSGYNALFALARLTERFTEDRSAAGSVYREYLARAPNGALAAQAREALCRLGDAASCD